MEWEDRPPLKTGGKPDGQDASRAFLSAPGLGRVDPVSGWDSQNPASNDQHLRAILLIGGQIVGAEHLLQGEATAFQ